MSAYEQRVEPADRNYQYIIVAAEPYENIAFKVVAPCLSSSSSCFVSRQPLSLLAPRALFRAVVAVTR
eukprot:2034249-Rhodomonas_salina.1